MASNRGLSRPAWLESDPCSPGPRRVSGTPGLELGWLLGFAAGLPTPLVEKREVLRQEGAD